jgi:hypothetical protein
MTEAEEYRLKDEADDRLEALLADYKGPDYVVLSTSIMEDTGQGLVHYRSVLPRVDTQGQIRAPRNRTRRIEVWHEMVTVCLHPGEPATTLPRFRRLGRNEIPLRGLLSQVAALIEPLPREFLKIWHDGKGYPNHLPRTLRALWEAHCQNASDPALAFSQGILTALQAMHWLSPEEVHEWTRRLQDCPGHACNASWCAYCGDSSGWKLCPPGQCNPCDNRRNELDQPCADDT